MKKFTYECGVGLKANALRGLCEGISVDLEQSVRRRRPILIFAVCKVSKIRSVSRRVSLEI